MTEDQKQALTEYIRLLVSTIRTQHTTEAKVLHYLEVEVFGWLWDRRIPVDSNETLAWMRNMYKQVLQEEQKGS